MKCREKRPRDDDQVASFLLAQVVVPNMACRVIDRAIQAHGGMGLCQDTFLADAYAHMRTLRIADGPDDVHVRSIAKYEYRRSTPIFSRL